MRVLVVHQNFPGQFAHMVPVWAARHDWKVIGVGRDTAPGLRGFSDLVRYSPHREVRRDQHPYLRQLESATLHGQAVARVLLALRGKGFVPDAILAHPGWGETLYVRDVFPDARLVHLCEWFYDAQGGDMGFDPEFPLVFDDRARVRTWNALHTLNLTACDAAVSPTHWQRSRHPALLRSRIAVHHEGIDLDVLGPDPAATLTLPGGRTLRKGDRVLTYVARNLEPYRGFHVFMRMLGRLQKRDSRVEAVIVGGDEVSYGRAPTSGGCWRQKMLDEVSIDPQRTHFLGRVPRATYLDVLRVSAAHVYLTYPFVLSWSLLEAMACAVPVVASDTAPVREVVTDGLTGRLFHFFDVDAQLRAVLEVLDDPPSAMRRALQARQAVGSYSHGAGTAGYENLLRGTAAAEDRRADRPSHDATTNPSGS